jgi:hypothetical protein
MVMTAPVGRWFRRWRGYQAADLARHHPRGCGEPAALGIRMSSELELADDSLVVGLGIQGASSLAGQLCGHEVMQHRRLPRLRWP